MVHLFISFPTNNQPFRGNKHFRGRGPNQPQHRSINRSPSAVRCRTPPKSKLVSSSRSKSNILYPRINARVRTRTYRTHKTTLNHAENTYPKKQRLVRFTTAAAIIIITITLAAGCLSHSNPRKQNKPKDPINVSDTGHRPTPLRLKFNTTNIKNNNNNHYQQPANEAKSANKKTKMDRSTNQSIDRSHKTTRQHDAPATPHTRAHHSTHLS